MTINEAEKTFLENVVKTEGTYSCQNYRCRGTCPIARYRNENDIDETCSEALSASIAKLILNSKGKQSNVVSPKSIEAANALIKKYESLTLKDVIGKTPNEITGFGSINSCTLCLVAKNADGTTKCNECIYQEGAGCQTGENVETYRAIHNADNSAQLVLAFYNRAQHIRTVLAKLEEAEKVKRTEVDLSSIDTRIEDPVTSDLMLCVRSAKEFEGKAFYLGENFTWEMKPDSIGNLCLIPTRKEPL